MKKIISITVAAFVLAVVSSNTVVAKEGVASLRGTQDIEGASLKVTKKKLVSKEGGFERNYKQQPPLIPHKIEKYKINLKNNGCLKCHSKKNHKKEKAPMLGESHFLTRDGKKLDHVSTRRYFCNQCHAPQMEATPLVKNDFEGVK
ncbi:nitrate reductase cytochrome c-type subunit [Thiolapillus sp.]|uniref:nitrate reductase cytochrome c-type subunit n=1 Tax=Thiolapillus sp. TaxID=2017437 RepID=UPI0025D478F1|nr:nitrate reductase cytochrome c-type subunit [Thiolapillus sp.]